jgi:hypothetical protein
MYLRRLEKNYFMKISESSKMTITQINNQNLQK